MPWGYLLIIAILLAFVGYNIDMMLKMSSDIKFIKLHVSKL